MKNKTFPIVLLLLLTHFCTAQSILLSGYVTDEATGESLIGANVFIPKIVKGTVTNEYGHYSLSLQKETKQVQFSYIGYESKTIDLSVEENQVLNISLVQSSLDEVVILEERTPANRKGIGKIEVPISVLESIPVIGGENDLMKSLSLFPGVSTGQEGNSGLFVRGGTPDQNLILLDGIPVYNANHLGGFFSVFNTHALNNVGVYKSNIPARYGGRLSSVIDITMREGNNQEFKGHFGIGALTSKLGLEGPIKKGKSSYLFTARTSYLGLINLFRDKEEQEFYLDYWLYDVNFKTNFNLDKGKLFFSVYSGNDILGTAEEGGSSSSGRILKSRISNSKSIWGNTTISTRYTQALSSKIFAKFLVGFAQYRLQTKGDDFFGDYRIDTLERTTIYDELTQNNDWIIRSEFDHSLSVNHLLKYGIGFIFHDFAIRNNETLNGVNTLIKDRYLSSDYYAFVEDELEYGNFSANIGLRFSGFHINEKHFAKLEPRIGLGYVFSDKTQANASFNTSRQFLHLLSPDGFGLPTDVWLPATQKAPPSDAYQITFGGNHQINKSLNFEIEGYYKEMTNLIVSKPNEFQDFGLSLDNWEEDIEVGGNGTSYGMEVLLKKERGKLSGFISYALSKTDRQFDALNNGDRFLFDYDRRHDFSIVAQYKLSKQWTLTSNWVYQSGRPVTLPVAGIPSRTRTSLSPIFAGLNNARMPAYHRLDIGIENTKTTKRGNTRLWKGSIYNAYNRLNPSYLRFSDNVVLNDDSQYLYSYNELEVTGLFSIIPSVSYELKF